MTDIVERFHPLKNLPGCMMPDGGECCVGYATLAEDWHKQADEIERLREQLAETVRERETYNGYHQVAVMELDKLREQLEWQATKIEELDDECQKLRSQLAGK